MAKAGRKTKLTPEMLLRIKDMVLADIPHAVIQEQLKIPKGTWDWWVNNDYQAFANLLWRWRLQRMLNKSVIVLENTLDKSDKENLKQDTAKYITSTIGKKDFSTKSELALAEGTKISIKLGDEPDEE